MELACSACPLHLALSLLFGDWVPLPHGVFYAGPPLPSAPHTMRGPRPTGVQALFTPSTTRHPLLFWAPGVMGRARVVLFPCFRVGLECLRPAGICVSVNLSPPVVLGPWHSRPSLPSACRQHSSGESQDCLPASVQQGAPALRGEAARRFYSAAVGGGRIRFGRDHSQLVLSSPWPLLFRKGEGGYLDLLNTSLYS